MEVKVNMAQVKKDDTSIDIFDFISLFNHNGKIDPTPLNPIGSDIIVDVAEDNKHGEIHLDKDFLDRLDIQTPLTVKRFYPNEQSCVLDGAEVSMMKGLRITLEFEYEGTYMRQVQDIRFNRIPSDFNAKIYIGTPIPNPQIFSDTIVPQYNESTSEVSLQTNGSGIPSNFKIIDIVGIL